MSGTDSLDAALIKALGHPLRARILELITERDETSPVELARELDERLGPVSPHTRVLRDLGCVELVRTEPRRGAVEHYYRAVTPPFLTDAQWEKLPRVLRRGLAGQTLRTIFAEASAAGGAGGFDPPGAHVDRMLLDLDERGWRDLSDLLVGVLRRAQGIQEQSDARRRRSASAGDGVRASELAILHFALGDVTPKAQEPAAQARRARSPRLP
jgi:DNA-binding transcriptional ArsR family regulator